MNYEAAKLFILQKLERELDPELTYHGIHHTLDVLAVAEELCQLEGIRGDEVTLVQTAVLYHDAGFTMGNKNHEVNGCEIARQTLPGFGYGESEISRICGMIMATKIPQAPENHLEQIICDADLDYLGRDDFFPIGNTLFAELRAFNVLHSGEEWNRLQIRFLEAHQYFTRTNIQRRGPKKQAYLEELKSLFL